MAKIVAGIIQGEFSIEVMNGYYYYQNHKDGHTYFMNVNNTYLMSAPTLIAGGFDEDCAGFVMEYETPLADEEYGKIAKTLLTLNNKRLL